MDEESTGRKSGPAAAPEEPGLADRLIREEFGEPTSATPETTPVPVVAPAASLVAEKSARASVHQESAEPVRLPRSRSHRTGMLAGLGVVGVLLAVLVLLSPGSGQPRLPVQSVQNVSPISANGPKTAAATVQPASAPSPTTSSTTPSPSTPTTQPRRSETAPTAGTYVYLPGTTAPAPPPTPTPTTSATVPTTTTAPPPPPTTTTTSPPTTTTTAKHCILGLIC